MGNLKYAIALKDAMEDAITATVGGSATLNIYSGTQPTSPDVAVTSQVLLATLTCNATLAPASSGGVLTLNSITDGTGTSAAGSGGTTATWWRLENASGTPLTDGSVGGTGAGADMTLNNTSIVTGATVSMSTFTITNGN